jgi:xanthine dehydrogenase YagR molybdenum-binding subunit
MRDGLWLIGWGHDDPHSRRGPRAPASAIARLLPIARGSYERRERLGPGTWTSMTKVAADTLSLPIEQVTFTLGDIRLPRAAIHGGLDNDGLRH